MTSSVVGLRSYKALPKPNLHQKKVLVTVWWSTAGLTHYSFLNPGETIPSAKYAQQIGEMHQKRQCLQPALVLREGPILSIQHSPRVAQSGPHSCLIHHIHLNSRQPTITSSIATTSCREISFTISRRQKMLSKSSRNPEAQIFMLWGINKVIFCWQKCVDCTGSYFD